MFVDGFMKARLGEIFEIGSGGTPSKKNPEYYNGNIPWIKTGDLKEKYLYKSEDYITELGLNNSSAKMCEPDTVLIAMYGATIGATSILKIPACTNQACATFKKSDKITPEFLYYFFRSQKERFVKDGVGGAQPNISAGYLKKIEIELLPLKKQNEITNTLDKLQSIITHIRTQLEKLDLLVKARFVEMFGNIENMCTIADVCSIITDGTHQPPKFTTDGIPFLFVSNIATNEIVYNAEKFISEETYNDLYKRTPIEIGDIILSTVGSYGHPAIVKTNKKFLFQRHIAYLKPIPTTINSIYLHRAILSDNVQRQIDERVKGIAQKTLNLSEIRKIVIPAPPLELQTQFANFVKQVDQSKSILQQELTQTQTLFNSLMQEYFG